MSETNSWGLSRFLDYETVGVTQFVRIGKIFDCVNIADDGWEVVLGKKDVSVSLRQNKIARWFDLMEMGIKRIVDIPFSIRCQVVTSCVDFEDAGKDKFFLRGFFYQDFAFECLVEDKFTLGGDIFDSGVMDS